jgi:molybdopterin/thiamine biosynthesis adenylyltransferase
MADEEIEVNYLRQLDWFNPTTMEAPTVHIIGCGGINSFTAFYLAQMGIKKLVLWDYDEVEEHNIPNQNFLLEHIGMKKTTALAKLIKDKVGIEVKIKDRFFSEDSKITDDNAIVIVGTDNISSRKIVYEHCKGNEKVKMFLDGRLGGLAFNIFTINPHEEADQELYEENLFEEGESDGLPCTAKSIIFVGAHIGALICQQVFAIMTERPVTKNACYDHLNNLIDIDGKAIMYGTA